MNLGASSRSEVVSDGNRRLHDQISQSSPTMFGRRASNTCSRGCRCCDFPLARISINFAGRMDTEASVRLVPT